MGVAEALEQVVAALPGGGEVRHGQIEMAQAVDDVLRDGGQLVVQAGTGVGKCLHPGTLLTLEDGSRRSIEELAGMTPRIAALDAELRTAMRPSAAIFPSGRKAVSRVETRLGRVVHASADHRFLTVRGWVPLRDLRQGDHIASARRIHSSGTTYLSGSELRFLAHMVAEGSCASSGPTSALQFTNFDPEVVADWWDATGRLNNAIPTITSSAGHYGVRRERLAGHERNGANVLLEEQGLLFKLAKHKAIPDEVFRCDEESLAIFLGRLYSGDGCVESPNFVVSLSSASWDIVEGVQHLLLRLGIVSKVRRKAATFNGRLFPAWEVDVLGAGPVVQFAETVGPHLVGDKRGRLSALVEGAPTPNPNRDVLPASVWTLVDKVRQERGISWNTIRAQATVSSDRTRGVSHRAMRIIADLCDDAVLDALAYSDIYWDEVVGILPRGEIDTFDVTMEGAPHFIANDLVVHNSLSYLVPAILSGRTTVIATATKALQDQLANKDLPFLQQHLGTPFEFAVLKGRANYLCLQKAVEIGEGDEQMVLDDIKEDEHGAFGQELIRLLKWAKTSKSGDRAELDFEPRARVWAQLSVSARECPGAIKCPQGESCFAEGAHQRAAQAQVIVVNTHLYATHLAIGGWLLPEHEVVIFDEAHALEDIASSAFGLDLTEGRLVALARSIRVAAPEEADALEAAGGRLADALEGYRGQRVSPAELERPLTAAAEAARRALGAIRESEDDENKRTRAMKAATTLVEDVAAVQSVDGDGSVSSNDSVTWVESSGPPTLKLAPINVAHLFAERLWENVRTAVLTSATIPSNLPMRLGLPAGHRQLSVDSPFDYENQSLLYCAIHLPDPRKPEYEEAMRAELFALIKAAGGRTLALFTSWRAMRAAAEALTPALPYRVLTQDALPKPALLKAFATDETSCLFATMGFWQGVDIPGAALSLLVIDKLPFSRPDEPLMRARRDRAGATAFQTVDLPRAASLLAQGAGRLIRTTADQGVVAVLDRRLATAGYRWDLIKALPPMRRTKERAEVERFLEGLVAANG